MYYDVERNDHGLPHDPFKSCVVPRPIGWISTLSRAKQPNLMVIGRVVGIHIIDDVLTEGMIDMSRFKPIARLGYQDYSVADNFFTMPFPYTRA